MTVIYLWNTDQYTSKEDAKNGGAVRDFDVGNSEIESGFFMDYLDLIELTADMFGLKNCYDFEIKDIDGTMRTREEFEKHLEQHNKRYGNGR